MSISIIQGDLFNTDCEVIAHQVNCQGKMKSGVALQVRKRYNIAYEQYLRRFREETQRLGETDFIYDKESRTHIVNMYSQNNYGYDGKRYTDYEAFYKCLENIRADMCHFGLKTLAFPYNIGCCRGGASWNIIYEMIKDVFNDSGFTVKIYQL